MCYVEKPPYSDAERYLFMRLSIPNFFFHDKSQCREPFGLPGFLCNTALFGSEWTGWWYGSVILLFSSSAISHHVILNDSQLAKGYRKRANILGFPIGIVKSI